MLPTTQKLACSPPGGTLACRLQLGPRGVTCARPGTVVTMAAAANVESQRSPDPLNILGGLQLIKQLEQQAMEAHEQAQELNKQGRYEEAQAKYAEMRRLDAAALEATQAIGCPSCRGEAGTAAACPLPNLAQPQDIQLYRQLHKPTAWPAEAAAGALSISQRAFGAILGCCVADAAAMPVQWIYDIGKLEQLVRQRQEATFDPHAGLEFYDPVQSTFLPMYTTGRNSPYGEQTLLLLQSLAEQGGFDCMQYATLYGARYRADFDGYMNASTVAFLRNSARGLQPPATGADDQQADCIARLAPLVAMFAGHERLMQLVEAATRTTQNTDAAVAWGCAGAAVLERLLMGERAAQAVEETVQELQQQNQSEVAGRMPSQQLAHSIAGHLATALQLQQAPHGGAVSELGRNCHMPNALQTPIQAVLHYEWQMMQQDGGMLADLSIEAKQNMFVAVIRDVLLAGGCCASRASYAGACLGAVLGPDAIPASWIERCDVHQKVQEWAAAICNARSN